MKHIQYYLYLVEMKGNGEKFYKIGVANKGAIYRYRFYKNFPYEIRVLLELDLGKEKALEIEEAVKSINKDITYIPKVYFGGSITECFSEYPTISLTPELVELKLTPSDTCMEISNRHRVLEESGFKEIDKDFLKQMQSRIDDLEVFSFRKRESCELTSNHYILSSVYINKIVTNKDKNRDLEYLKKDLYNFFANICNKDSSENMWGCHISIYPLLKGKGYTKGYVKLGEVKCDESKTNLAFVYNLFPPNKDEVESRYSINMYRKLYAIEKLFKWALNSAFGNGQKVKIFIPVKRMRDLLEEFRSMDLDNIENKQKNKQESQ